MIIYLEPINLLIANIIVTIETMMTHNSRIGGAIFVSIADCLAELLQPLPQVARFGDAEVDTLLVVKLYLKPQLVLPKTCTHTHAQ